MADPVLRQERSFTGRHAGLLLLSILVLAAALRIPGLDSVPPGLFSDEASTGYDAFCLLKTGRDQYGEVLPLFARSLGDYNEALYRYLCIPFVYFLGLDEFSVRLPAALIGVATVAILFFLIRYYFGTTCALLCGLMLAVSPWHVLLTRVGFRACLLPFFVCLGWLLLEKSRRSKWLLPVSAASFSLGLYSYSPARLIVPAMVLALAFQHRRRLEKEKFAVFASVCLGLAMALPALIFFTSPEAWERATQTLHPYWQDNLLFYYSYFSPEFLFFSGDPNLRHNLPFFGQLNHFELLTVPAGLIFWWKRGGRTLPFWIFLAVYPAAAALTAPWHALRGISGTVVFASASGCGIYFLCRSHHFRLKRIFPFGLTGVIAANLAFFTYAFFVAYPLRSGEYWLTNQNAAIRYAASQKNRPVLISNRLNLPHIFVLFFDQYSPAAYQAAPVTNVTQGKSEAGGNRIGRFFITDFSKKAPLTADTLAVATLSDLPTLKKIYPHAAVSKIFGAFNSESSVVLVEIWNGLGKTIFLKNQRRPTCPDTSRTLADTFAMNLCNQAF